MVPLYSNRISRVPPYSRILFNITHTGLSPSMVSFSKLFKFFKQNYWPSPRSLATTNGISIDFFSSGYLDVSVLQVTLLTLCVQIRMHKHDSMRVSPFGNLRINACSGSPKLIAAAHVLHHTVHQDIPHMPLIS